MELENAAVRISAAGVVRSWGCWCLAVVRDVDVGMVIECGGVCES